MQPLSIPKIPFDEIRFAITGLIADGDKEDYSGISDDRESINEMIDQVKEKLSYPSLWKLYSMELWNMA